MCVHSPFGAPVNSPWALALTARLRERYGVDGHAVASDDGIVLRLPDMETPPPAEVVVFSPEEIEEVVTAELGGSAVFASRFRECAARSLLLPRRRPGAGRRYGSSANDPRSCSRSPANTANSRLCWRRCGNASTTFSTFLA